MHPWGAYGKVRKPGGMINTEGPISVVQVKSDKCHTYGSTGSEEKGKHAPA